MDFGQKVEMPMADFIDVPTYRLTNVPPKRKMMETASTHIFKNIRLDDLADLASRLRILYPNENLWTFYGEMGAGKTTFIKTFCKVLGVKDQVVSPTFAMVNEYGCEDGSAVFHFDFYRINRLEEAYDMGYETYFFSGNPCLVEWPEKIEPLLDMPHVRVEISAEADDTRTFKIEKRGGRL